MREDSRRLREPGPCDVDQARIKAALGRRLLDTIKTKNLTQLAAAEVLSIDQPKVSRLLHGELREFSTPRLLRFLALLGQDIDIIVRDPAPAERRTVGQLRVVANGGSHR